MIQTDHVLEKFAVKSGRLFKKQQALSDSAAEAHRLFGPGMLSSRLVAMPSEFFIARDVGQAISSLQPTIA